MIDAQVTTNPFQIELDYPKLRRLLAEPLVVAIFSHSTRATVLLSNTGNFEVGNVYHDLSAQHWKDLPLTESITLANTVPL